MKNKAFTPANGRRNTAFTLIELLITVAIIAIVMSFLFPLYSNITERSRAATCTNQLKSLYTIFTLYMQDSNGAFPPASAPPPSPVPWTKRWRGTWYNPTYAPEESMAAYVEGGVDALRRLVVCPSNRAKDIVPVTGAYGYPYVCNYEVMRQSGLAVAPTRYLSINAHKALLLADSAIGADWGWGITALSISGSAWNRLSERHGGRANVLWADGRITAEQKADLGLKDFETSAP